VAQPALYDYGVTVVSSGCWVDLQWSKLVIGLLLPLNSKNPDIVNPQLM